MTHTIETLPIVHPMMVRRFTPDHHGWGHFRDKLFLVEGGECKGVTMEVEEVGMADSRLSFDEDVVDQSGAVLEFTTEMMLHDNQGDVIFLFFTSRRWREHRYAEKKPDGYNCDAVTHQMPLLFIGNPYMIARGNGEITVIRESSYLIKSGMQLQAEWDELHGN